MTSRDDDVIEVRRKGPITTNACNRDAVVRNMDVVNLMVGHDINVVTHRSGLRDELERLAPEIGA